MVQVVGKTVTETPGNWLQEHDAFGHGDVVKVRGAAGTFRVDRFVVRPNMVEAHVWDLHPQHGQWRVFDAARLRKMTARQLRSVRAA